MTIGAGLFYDGKTSARTTAFHAACVAAGIDANLSDNISRTLWLKFAMLAPLSGMTALTRGPLGPIRRNPDSYALIKAAVEETVAVGIALKAGLDAGDAARTLKLIDGLPDGMMASMCHDLLAGKPIEVEGLSGAVARLVERRNPNSTTATLVPDTIWRARGKNVRVRAAG